MASMTTVLKKVYKEGLEPLGFVQLKGRHPYFVRVIGGEIIQVISFRKEPGCVMINEGGIDYFRPELDSFGVRAGISTVYRRNVDLSVSIMNNFNWCRPLSLIYSISCQGNLDDEFWEKINSFIHHKTDEKSMIEVWKYSLEMIKKVVISIFDKVTDLKKCVEYLEQYNGMLINVCDNGIDGWDDIRFGTDPESEGLLYVKANTKEEIKEKMKSVFDERYEIYVDEYKNTEIEDYDTFCKNLEDGRIEKLRRLYRIFDTQNVYKNAVTELERRKKQNIEGLRLCGLDI